MLGDAGDAWVAGARQKYAELGNWAADRLGVHRPDGSPFLFVDVAESLDEGALPAFLERAVERGLLVAPGPSFGPYSTHVRVLFHLGRAGEGSGWRRGPGRAALTDG